ncbi:MAG: FAD/NAD(P)-binding protein [Actinomycetota bacterium]|nr:FAD/NAD(P)-binding protein [Actinomycetota bacterium]MCL6092491.1 FAD/NAD(P)-binding protein [Actinomycetota bacterium]MDA8167984.1 FAD/NAD(P)-binding protein [Actinomycetota bacterium]
MSTIPKKGINATTPLVPEPATVVAVIQETPAIRTYRLVFDDPALMAAFMFAPGQIGLISIFGAGESTFAISSPPSQKDYIQFSVMRTGAVTSAIHELAEGDRVALRAPLGCAFPVDSWKEKDVIIAGGGIGMAPLRSLLMHLLDNRGDFGRIQAFYGARTPADLCYAEDRAAWEARADVDFIAAIDAAHPDWSGRVGLLPGVLEEEQPPAAGAVAVICGPPVMIKFTLQSLERLGFGDQQIFTTLERRMKCGIGLCGRCNVGPKYVCTDGPVFTLDELRRLPAEL